MSELNRGAGDEGQRETDEARPVLVEELDALFDLLRAYDKIFLAVSGGADSLALMHLVADWLSGRATDAAVQDGVTVLTVDHGLRREARVDALFVKQAAEARGLRAEILKVDEAAPASGIQEWARAVRYRLLFGRAAGQGGCCAVVTAHHRDDLAETVLMRLSRGSGIDGMAAMAPVTFREGVALLRPLLDIPKSRLIQTLAVRGVTWIEDPSNEQLTFERVRLRRATRARAELGLGDAALSLTARRMARARDALETLTDAVLTSGLGDPRLRRAGVFPWVYPAGQLPDELAIRALQRVVSAVGGAAKMLRLARVERLFADMASAGFRGASLGRCVITAGPRIGRRGHDEALFYIYREVDRSELPVIETEFRTAVIWDNRFVVSRAGPENGKVRVRAAGSEDLTAMACGGRGDIIASLPPDALRATPVVETADGQVTLLVCEGLERFEPGSGELGTQNGSYQCRFLEERLVRDRPDRVRIKLEFNS